MGGGEKKKANEMADTQYKDEKAATDKFSAEQNNERIGARGRADDLNNALMTGYKDMLNNKVDVSSLGGSGGVSAPQYTRDKMFDESTAGYRDFAKTGGVDTAAMRQSDPTYKQFQQTGGVDGAALRQTQNFYRGAMDNGLVDADRKASIEDTIGSMKQFGKTGGLDDTAMARMRGNGGFEEFAKTGGLSEGDRSNIRARATSVIPAAYQRATDEAKRMRSVQGGYGPGASAMQDKMLRGSNADAASASLNAELGITDQVNQGRKWGIQGQADSEGNLQQLRTGNMARGMEGAATADSDLMHTIQQGREYGASSLDANEQAASKMEQAGKMWGADSLSANEGNIQKLVQGGKQYGNTGLFNTAESNQAFADKQASANASASNSNSMNSAENQKWALNYNRDSKLSGLSGLNSLYQETPGEIAMYDQNNLANRGLTNNVQSGIIDQKFANNPSGMDNFKNILASTAQIAGGVGGMMSGVGLVGGLIPKKKPATTASMGAG